MWLAVAVLEDVPCHLLDPLDLYVSDVSRKKPGRLNELCGQNPFGMLFPEAGNLGNDKSRVAGPLIVCAVNRELAQVIKVS